MTIELSSSPNSSKMDETPFGIINRTIVHRDPNCGYWWSATGTILARLLKSAEYPLADQYRLLTFYATYIVPELGNAPGALGSPLQWKCALVNDPTPVEFSWNWGNGKKLPIIRFIIEAVGAEAGSDSDPLNELAQDRLLQRLQPILPSLDLGWYQHFSRLVIPKRMKNFPGGGLKSRTFLGLDLEGSEIVLKAYFYPRIKAIETGRTNEDVLLEAFKALPPTQQSIYLGFQTILDYIHEAPTASQLKVELMAIDCLTPMESRIKIYVRSQSTSFESAKQAMTLNGRIDSSKYELAFKDLEELWHLCFQDAHGQLVPDNAPHNAGVLFYYELRIGSPLTPKLNIPVHYIARSDSAVLKMVKGYFAKRGSKRLLEAFESVLEETFSKKCLEARGGANTYIGCTIKPDGLHLVSYISPQIYDRMIDFSI